MKQRRHKTSQAAAISPSSSALPTPLSSLRVAKTRTRRQASSSSSLHLSSSTICPKTVPSAGASSSSSSSISASSTYNNKNTKAATLGNSKDGVQVKAPAPSSSSFHNVRDNSYVPLPPPPPKRFTRQSIQQFHQVLSKHSFRKPFPSPLQSQSQSQSPIAVTTATAHTLPHSSSPKTFPAASTPSEEAIISSSKSTMASTAETTTKSITSLPSAIVSVSASAAANTNENRNENRNNNSSNGSKKKKSNFPSLSRPLSSRRFSSQPSQPLSFQEIYETPASLGKQLEIRWFHSDIIAEIMKQQQQQQKQKQKQQQHKAKGTFDADENGEDNEGDNSHGKHEQKILMKQHTMPFLRRSFSFIQISNILSTHKNSNANVDSSSKMKIISCTNRKMNIKKKEYHPIHDILHQSSSSSSDHACNQDNNSDDDSSNKETSNCNNNMTKAKKRKKLSVEAEMELSKSIFRYRIRQFNPKLSHNATDRTTRKKKKAKYNEYSTFSSSPSTPTTNNSSSSSNNKSSTTYKKIKKAIKQKIRASTYGKTFPPYRPYEKGVWNAPVVNKNAFELYCERQMGRELTAKYLEYMAARKKEREDWNERDEEGEDTQGNDNNRNDGSDYYKGGDEMSQTTIKNGNERQERIIFRKIKEKWENLSNSGEKLYWTQEEAWDKERYLHEKCIYDTAREQGVDAVAECSNEIGGSFNGITGFFINGLDSYDKTNDVSDTINNRLNSGNVFYHFVYYNGDELEIQKEWRNDRRCPFCSFHAGSNKGILTHCKTTHGDSLTFDGGIDEGNNFHVMIRSIHCRTSADSAQINTSTLLDVIQNEVSSKRDLSKNFAFFCSKYKNNHDFSTLTHEDVNILFIPKPEEMTKHLEPAIRKQKIRSLEQQHGDVHPQAKLQYIVAENQGPIRQYYHSRTNLPISRIEWDQNKDSDDEDDDCWIRQLGESLMDELGDVSVKEKRFMKLWNVFIKSDVVISDATIPDKCREFILAHHNQLMRHELRKHLLLHLFNLWDNGIVMSWEILQMMNLFDEMKSKRYVPRRKMSEGISRAVEEKKLTE